MKKLHVILIAMLMGTGLSAQNLVTNGNFSSKAGSGCDLKDFDTTPANWAIAPTGYTHTPDFYHTCAGAGNVNYPGSNWNGCADPEAGTGYIGLLAHPPALNAYHDAYFEYVHQQLSSSLTQGINYYIEFYVRPANSNSNNAAVKTLGMLLVDNLAVLTTDAQTGLHHLTPQIQDASQFYNDVTGWTKISGTFTPTTSGVKHIIIGNFDPAVNTGQGDFEILPGHDPASGKTAYYFIDAVYIAPALFGEPDLDPEVNGVDVVCTSNTTQTLTNYNTLATVTWQATPSSWFTTSSGSGASANLKASNALVSGNATLTFAINGVCDTEAIQKTFRVGKPAGVTTNPSGVPAIQASVGNWIDILATTTAGSSIYSLNWWTNNSAALDLIVSPGNCTVECRQTGYNYVYVTASNSCGTSVARQIPINVTSGGGGGMFQMSMTYSPNPVKDVLNRVC